MVHSTHSFSSMLRNLSIILLFSFTQMSAQSLDASPWYQVQESSVGVIGTRYIIPTEYKTFSADVQSLLAILQKAPAEFSQEAQQNPQRLLLPLPNGTYVAVNIVSSSIMEPALAEKFPMIRTYAFRGVEERLVSGRLDFTPAGFHAMIFTNDGTVYIDPFQTNDISHYISYYKKDYLKRGSLLNTNPSCLEDNPEVREELETLLKTHRIDASGEILRTYRLACAATGEYTAFHGGTVVGGMSGIVTTVNRVTGIYEKEVSVRMVLVANNDLLVYTNASTDPYSNNNGSTMLSQNQTNVDNLIGNANYDIGHVFSTGGGGIAGLGVVCRTGQKARGVTGSPQPVGDPFDVDYVAHEMGHQYAGNHSFNGSSGSCSGGNRNGSTAFEPGSGSTIMAYAGICSPQDLQSNSDAYFHRVNLTEIIAYTSVGSGSSCPTTINTGNLPPTVTVPTGGFTIPISTPFALSGSAVDPNNDPLTYCWEQYDLGPQGAPTSPSGNAPIFRSFLPVTTGTRTFPKLSNLLNNTTTIGEILPTYSRTLTFQLTARDNKVGGGGVGSAQVQFQVTNTAGPFLVTAPNSSVTWNALTQQTVTWNVANTNVAPVNCANVNILLSTDGGQTYPIVVAANTPNDGSEDILVPNNVTTTARIKVQAADNIFFDISNTNFTITDPIPVELTAFTVTSSKDGVLLRWETATETNNSGFSIEKSVNAGSYQSVGFVEGKGTTTEKQYYTFTDRQTPSGSVTYRLKQVDFDGTFAFSQVVMVDVVAPDHFVLEQNHPNPFNPSTSIRFSVKSDANITLAVFDQLGQQVAMLLSGLVNAGVYTSSFDASMLPSGIYFYRLTAADQHSGAIIYSKTQKMLLMK